MRKVVILGAGISGLSAAWFLKRKYQRDIHLTILEKADHVGGWIQTIQKDGFLFEAGPRGFRPKGKGQAALSLIHELGLDEQLIPADPKSRKRYIYLNGKLQTFSAFFLLKQGIISALFHDFFTPPLNADDETIGNFVRRRFNKRLAENLMDPLVKGIFGGDIDKLSIRSCLPFLWKGERENGSVLRSFLSKPREKKRCLLPSLYSFKEGMATLPKTLAAQLDAEIVFSHSLSSLENIDADLIISAIPTHALAQLVKCEDPLEYASISAVNLGWKKPVLKKRGYGFLIPSHEKSEVMGMTWDSEIFPNQNDPGQTRICVMMNKAGSDEDLYLCAIKNLETYLDISLPPDTFIISTAKNAIPQYTFGYHRRIESFKQKLPSHCYAIGNCFDGVGINDCIFGAKKLVEQI